MANEPNRVPDTNPLETAKQISGAGSPRAAERLSSGVAEVEKRLRDNDAKAADQRAAKSSSASANPLYPSGRK